MLRFDATQLALRHAGDSPIVGNLGPTSDELYHAGHRDRNFYTYGSMGLCSSIALGMALSTADKVIALDGDGSLLMNLGAIATIGRENPSNLVVASVGQRSLGADGRPDQPHRNGHRSGGGGPFLRHPPGDHRPGFGDAGGCIHAGDAGAGAVVHRGQD